MKLSNISLAGVVLAGGLSKRMQQDKKFLEYQGRTFLDIATNNLKPFCNNIFLSLASVSTLHSCIVDELPNIGPISGILSALKYNIQEDYILFIPIDMPLLKPHLLENLIVNIKGKGINYEDNVFPFIIKNSQEVLDVLQSLINQNSYSIKNFLQNIASVSLPINEEDKLYLQNINYYEQFLGLPHAK